MVKSSLRSDNMLNDMTYKLPNRNRQYMISKLAKVMGCSVTMLALAITVNAHAASNTKASSVATLYADSCAACHDSGALGAPKTGDKATWQRLQSKKGMTALVNSVKNGMPQMPAGGLCAECTDTQYQQLIDYMTNAQ